MIFLNSDGRTPLRRAAARNASAQEIGGLNGDEPRVANGAGWLPCGGVPLSAMYSTLALCIANSGIAEDEQAPVPQPQPQ